MIRALSIYFPDLAIRLARRRACRRSPREGRAAHEPTAWLLYAAQRGAQYVVHACGRSVAAGVRAGMTLAHARALLAGTTVYDAEYAPQRDAAALAGIARWMLRFSPVVAPDDPDGLLLNIGGCERLFGGERNHVQQIARVFETWELPARLAVAPTYGCARAVARHAGVSLTFVPADGVDAALAPLPVGALRIDADTEEALSAVGVESIGQVLDLPREALAARFGAALLHQLDQATGVAPETLQPIRSVRRFEAFREFEGPILQWSIIEATTRALLTDLLVQARGVERGVLVLHVELRRVDLAPETLTLRFTYPTRDERHLWGLLRPRLERAHLGYGVEAVTVRAERTARVLPEQASFLRDPVDDARSSDRAVGELVDRLTDRLGESAVARARLVDAYLPERAFILAPLDETVLKRSAPTAPDPLRPYHAHRPARLLETPEPARVISLVPDGPPAWIEWRGKRAGIVSSAGPERITIPWWTEGRAATRDYYEVDDEAGRRLWVYRSPGGGAWCVHGQWT